MVNCGAGGSPTSWQWSEILQPFLPCWVGQDCIDKIVHPGHVIFFSIAAFRIAWIWQDSEARSTSVHIFAESILVPSCFVAHWSQIASGAVMWTF